MRHILKHTLSLVVLFSSALVPSLGHAQWEVRPAPSSWGLPQSRPQTQAPVQAQVENQTPTSTTSVGPAARSAANGSTNMNDAIACSAALQLATMAAPNWARERGITNITNAWLQKVFALSEPQGISGDRVPSVVEAEMQNQINAAAYDPSLLSRKAFDCASRQP
jgi:hypothetical protein